MRRLAALFSLIAALAFAVPAIAKDEPRLALLIGNEEYPAEPGRLRRPHSDVETLGAALERAGFSVVIERDANAAAIRGAVSAFAGRLENAGADAVGFFYYAGHGAVALSDGRRRNFMLPAGVTVASAADAALSGVRLDIAIDAMENAGAASLFVVYDACRNSYLRSSGDRGIAVERTRGGLLLAMSTMADATTPDDGAYAIALADQIGRSGQSAEVAFINASRAVGAGRPRDQLPTVSPSLIEPFCFLSCNRDNAAATDIAATTPAASADQIVFNTLATPCEYAAFARDYADSPLAFTARQRAGSTPPCDEAPAPNPGAGVDIAEEFIARLEARDHTGAYDMFGASARAFMNAAMLRANIDATMNQLGGPASQRTLLGAAPSAQLPGPDGRMIQGSFLTARFEARHPVGRVFFDVHLEQVDGAYMVVGYYITHLER